MAELICRANSSSCFPTMTADCSVASHKANKVTFETNQEYTYQQKTTEIQGIAFYKANNPARKTIMKNKTFKIRKMLNELKESFKSGLSANTFTLMLNSGCQFKDVKEAFLQSPFISDTASYRDDALDYITDIEQMSRWFIHNVNECDEYIDELEMQLSEIHKKVNITSEGKKAIAITNQNVKRSCTLLESEDKCCSHTSPTSRNHAQKSTTIPPSPPSQAVSLSNAVTITEGDSKEAWPITNIDAFVVPEDVCNSSDLKQIKAEYIKVIREKESYISKLEDHLFAIKQANEQRKLKLESIKENLAKANSLLNQLLR